VHARRPLFCSPPLCRWTSPSRLLPPRPPPPGPSPKPSSSAADPSTTGRAHAFGVKLISDDKQKKDDATEGPRSFASPLHLLPPRRFPESHIILYQAFSRNLKVTVPLCAHPCWPHPAASCCGPPRTCSCPPPTHSLSLPIPPPAASAEKRGKGEDEDVKSQRTMARVQYVT